MTRLALLTIGLMGLAAGLAVGLAIAALSLPGDGAVADEAARESLGRGETVSDAARSPGPAQAEVEGEPKKPADPSSGAASDSLAALRHFARPESAAAVLLERLATEGVWQRPGIWELHCIGQLPHFIEIVIDCSRYGNGKIVILGVIHASEDQPCRDFDVDLLFEPSAIYNTETDRAVDHLWKRLDAVGRCLEFSEEEHRRLAAFFSCVYLPGNCLPATRKTAMEKTLQAMPSRIRAQYAACWPLTGKISGDLGLRLSSDFPTLGAELSDRRVVELIFAPLQSMILFGNDRGEPPCQVWSLAIRPQRDDSRSRTEPSSDPGGLLYWPRLTQQEVDGLKRPDQP